MSFSDIAFVGKIFGKIFDKMLIVCCSYVGSEFLLLSTCIFVKTHKIIILLYNLRKECYGLQENKLGED